MRFIFSLLIIPIFIFSLLAQAQADPLDYFYGHESGDYGADGSDENPFGLPELTFPGITPEKPELEPQIPERQIVPRFTFPTEKKEKEKEEEEEKEEQDPVSPTRLIPESIIPGLPSWITPTYDTGRGKIYCLGYRVIDDIYCCVGIYVPGSEYREPTLQEYGLYCGIEFSF